MLILIRLRLGKRNEEKDKLTVFAQPGATWGELIEFLNPYGITQALENFNLNSRYFLNLF